MSSVTTVCDTRMAHAVCSYFASLYAEELFLRGYSVHVDESHVHGDGLSLWLLRDTDGLEPTLKHFPDLFLAARVERKCWHFTPTVLPSTGVSFVYATLRAMQQGELACLAGSRGNGHDVLIVELLPSMRCVENFESFSIPLMARVLPLLDADEEQLHSCAKFVAFALGRSFLDVYAS